MQCRTLTTLFLDSTGLLEQSTFAILEKIARVTNDTRLRWFREYRLLEITSCVARKVHYHYAKSSDKDIMHGYISTTFIC